jgi:TetR/AcrR family transcriptional regulator, cholesterol catabolism regulator
VTPSPPTDRLYGDRVVKPDTRSGEVAKPSRRNEIFERAADIFWEKGYHATSMNDVAAAMRLQKASLYYHVQTKQTLLYEMSVQSMQHMIDTALAVPVVDPVERLETIIHRHVEILLEDRSKHAVALTELRSLTPDERQHVTDLRDRYERLIDEAVRSVQTTTGRWDGVPPRLVRLGLLGMLNWTVFWFDPAGPDTPAQLAAAFARIFIGDLDPHRG